MLKKLLTATAIMAFGTLTLTGCITINPPSAESTPPSPAVVESPSAEPVETPEPDIASAESRDDEFFMEILGKANDEFTSPEAQRDGLRVARATCDYFESGTSDSNLTAVITRADVRGSLSIAQAAYAAGAGMPILCPEHQGAMDAEIAELTS